MVGNAGILLLSHLIINCHKNSPTNVPLSFRYKVNADYLKEMDEKEKRKADEELERKRKEEMGEIVPKRKRKTRSKGLIEANTAGEAIEKMLEERRLSNKINYEVLRSL